MASSRLITLELAQTMAAMERSMTHASIAQVLGFNKSTIQRSLARLRAGDGFESAQQFPPVYNPNVEAHQIHIAHILDVEPNGFRWLKDCIAERFYQLEIAPPRRRMFGAVA